MAQRKDFPKSFGLLLYPQFEVLDMAGPMETLNCLAQKKGFVDMTLSIISRSLDPVSPGINSKAEASSQFAAKQLYLPTHTLDTAPQLDVLIIPGGIGAVETNLDGSKSDFGDYVEFVRKCYHGYDSYYPLKHMISICNAAGVVARAGVLDGRKATTNKAHWAVITAEGPKTHWISKARWVNVDNIWTSSGVSAGTDCVLAWLSTIIAEDIVDAVCNEMEWNRARDAENDPFSTVFKCEDVLPKTH